MIQINETILVIVLTWCVTMLFGMLVARSTHTAMLRQNPDVFALTMRHCNRLDTIRDLIISEQINFKH